MCKSGNAIHIINKLKDKNYIVACLLAFSLVSAPQLPGYCQVCQTHCWIGCLPPSLFLALLLLLFLLTLSHFIPLPHPTLYMCSWIALLLTPLLSLPPRLSLNSPPCSILYYTFMWLVLQRGKGYLSMSLSPTPYLASTKHITSLFIFTRHNTLITSL